MTAKDYQRFALDIRISVVEMLAHRGFGHVGGSLSIADVVAVLYGSEMKIFPDDPKNEERDRFVLGKGHAGPCIFAALALKGFFDKELLYTLCDGGTKLPSHCDRLLTPGIDASTGSLGQGLSLACGLAHGFKIQNRDNKVFAILGDGELQEGEVWEAAMYAGHYNLNNITAFVDWNKKQVDGYVSDIMNVASIEDKFKAFGWYAVTVKGDDCDAILAAIKDSQNNRGDKPAVIVLDTVKGGGVPEYANMFANHSITFDQEVAKQAIAGLKARRAELGEGD